MKQIKNILTSVSDLMKHMESFLTISMVLSFLSCTMNVQAASTKSKVKSTVNNFIKYGKVMNTKAKNYTWDKTFALMDDGISADNALLKFYKQQNKKYFKYSIKSVKVKGSKATVKLSLRYRSYYNATRKAIIEVARNSLETDTGNQIYSKLAQYINIEAKQYKPVTKKKTITITVTKKQGKWKIKETTDSLADSLTCDLVTALNN